jgi:hypothetical protein
MGAKEQYEANKRAYETKEDKKKWWFKQREPIDRFTGWLVVWTALLFIATVGSVVVLHSTDEKIKESYAAVQRPFITAKEVIIDPSMMPGYWMFGVRFENSGSTPTSEMEFMTISDRASPGDPEDIFRSPTPLNSKFSGLLGPKAQDIPVGTQSGIPVNSAREMAISRANYYIRGVVHYRDLFKDSIEHVTKFCFAVIPYLEGNELKSGIQRCLYWNCADDECTKDRKRFDAAVIAANPPKSIK